MEEEHICVCLACEGTGSVVVPYDEHHILDSGLICPECDGEGSVPGEEPDGDLPY